MNYMASIYGVKTLAGQQGLVGQNVALSLRRAISANPDRLGRRPVRGSDFIDYSPSRIEHGSNPNGGNRANRQFGPGKPADIPTMMWHWNAPTDLIDQPGKRMVARLLHRCHTTFDVQAALANPPAHRELTSSCLRDIDAIAVELKKFQDAGVPVIWRPLHEAATAGWFWLGPAKGPQPFKDLWRLMYDRRLTRTHGLHNLIWEFTTSPADEGHLDWYPGDDVVDIVGLDIYTNASSSMSGQWLRRARRTTTAAR